MRTTRTAKTRRSTFAATRLPSGIDCINRSTCVPSGALRPTYRLWEKHRGNLQRLPAAANDYGQLDVHLWQRGSGKVTLSKPGEQAKVAAVLCDLVDQDPASEWLIVHYLSETGIVETLKADSQRSPRIRSLTWGRHRGTNQFADVSNVVIIGQLTYRAIDYKALASAASGLPVATVGTEADLEDFRWGEFQHHLLQALCRASVRRSRNGIAGACRAYVIATPSTHTEARVRETFPGCRLHSWKPVEKPVSEAASSAMGFLRSKADAGVTEVRKREVYEHVGMKPKNFSRDVGQVAAFQAFLKETGWRQDAHKFMKAFSAFPSNEAEEGVRPVVVVRCCTSNPVANDPFRPPRSRPNG